MIFDDPNNLAMAFRLIVALAIGGVIGLERSYHGRSAGFRTHALVCMSTCLLMLVTDFQSMWFEGDPGTRTTLDPTRMAQGIMTGIGFLGAGSIIKDGLTIRGLTTAASLWTTAALGILFGIGFYFPGAVATALTLGTLSFFRWIENKLPSYFYAECTLRFRRDEAMPEKEIQQLLAEHHFAVTNVSSFHLDEEAGFFECSMTIRCDHIENVSRLTEALKEIPAIREFRIAATGNSGQRE
ncbi:MAG: MgtC/SapB family protein [Pirellulales bacterium]